MSQNTPLFLYFLVLTEAFSCQCRLRFKQLHLELGIGYWDGMFQLAMWNILFLAVSGTCMISLVWTSYMIFYHFPFLPNHAVFWRLFFLDQFLLNQAVSLGLFLLDPFLPIMMFLRVYFFLIYLLYLESTSLWTKPTSPPSSQLLIWSNLWKTGWGTSTGRSKKLSQN